MRTSLQEVTPDFETLDHGKEFFVVYLVIAFRWNELPGVVRDRSERSIDISLRENARDGEVGGIAFYREWLRLVGVGEESGVGEDLLDFSEGSVESRGPHEYFTFSQKLSQRSGDCGEVFDKTAVEIHEA